MPEASTTGVHQGGQKQESLAGVVLFSLLVIGAVVGFFYWWHNFRNISGTIVSNASTLGDWTMRPDQCRLLQNGGVELTQASQPALRAIVSADPEGGPAQVSLTSPQSGQSYMLEHDRCGDATLEVHRGEDGLSSSGEIAFSCVAGNNGTVRGDVKFRNCK